MVPATSSYYLAYFCFGVVVAWQLGEDRLLCLVPKKRASIWRGYFIITVQVAANLVCRVKYPRLIGAGALPPHTNAGVSVMPDVKRQKTEDDVAMGKD